MFALGIEFLTGTAVMTSADTRDTAEWPPHPARVFMALVAGHGETRSLPEDGAEALSAWEEERGCLEWLEQQAAPELSFAKVPEEQRRKVVKYYVPVNDPVTTAKPAGVKAADLRDALGVMPSARSKQERTFPAVSPGLYQGRNLVHLIWRDADLPGELTAAFHRLAAKVIRIGHSSSLTRVWIAEEERVPASTLVPGISGRQALKLRGISAGLLADLDQCFNADDIDTFFVMSQQIEAAKGNAKATAAAKSAFKERFGEEWTKTLAAPLRRYPSGISGLGYIEPSQVDAAPAESVFDPELLILTKMEGKVLGLESTNLLMEALRGTLLQGSEDAPPWFTGHKAPGEPAESPHLAMFPLAYVGSEYADGHVLGLALAFPRDVPSRERMTRLRHLLWDAEGGERDVLLRLGGLGTWSLRPEDRGSPPLALRAETWTHASTVWASVTPVVLDRHPKTDPSDPREREAWRREVTAVIAAACRNIGLPTPSAVDIDKTSWHRGSPRSKPGSGGMPWLTSKSNAARQQVHALLQFDREVTGPVVLGAGRYRGYGLFKPLGQRPQ